MIGAFVAVHLTNFYYAAAGMHVAPFQYYFVPYYFLAVAAIFGHIACAMHWLLRDKLGKHRAIIPATRCSPPVSWSRR